MTREAPRRTIRQTWLYSTIRTFGTCAGFGVAVAIGGAAEAYAEPLVDTGELSIAVSGQEALEEAYRALTERRFDQAASLFRGIAESGGGDHARLGLAIAAYEAGDLRQARSAAEEVLKNVPKSLSAGNVLGLTLLDSGDVAGGVALLQQVYDLAKKSGNKLVMARSSANLALAWLDRGEVAKAQAALDEASVLGTETGAADVIAAVEQSRAALAALSGKDGGVGQLLGRGDVRGARAAAQTQLEKAPTRRDSINAAIQLAAVERAEGRLGDAHTRLEEAIHEARAAGMRREVAYGTGQLGIVDSLAGRQRIAADRLLAAAGEAQQGGYRVIEVDLRCELGLTLVQLDRVDEAVTQQRLVGALLGQMDYPQGVARQAELGGLIAGFKGDLSSATDALSRSVSYYESLGRHLDAGRAATALAALLEPTRPTEAETWAGRARSLFAKAGEQLGPAHVALARALANARARQLDRALLGFAEAAELAGKVGGQRAETLAAIAREDAAQTLVMYGSDADLARASADAGLSALVRRQQQLAVGFESYDGGLAAYNLRDFAKASRLFADSRASFEALGESAYALRAQRAAGWSNYNATIPLKGKAAVDAWGRLTEEVARLGDAELYARVYGASVLTRHAEGLPDLRIRLDECVRLSTIANLPEVAARCHAAIAETEGDLEDRAKNARLALKLAPKDGGTIAGVYGLAIDAYNAGRTDLAREMAQAIRPNAGSAGEQLDEILKGPR